VSLFFASLGFGIVTAAIIAVAGVGMSLQFGVTNFVNFAFGDFMTVGMYLALVFASGLGLTVYQVLPLVVVTTGLLGVITNRLVLAPFTRRKASPIILLIVTIGVSLVIQSGLLAAWGSHFQRLPLARARPLHLGPFLVTPWQLGVVAIAVVVMVFVHGLLRYSRLGKAMRAMSDRRSLARVVGLRTARLTDWTWFISTALAGLAGVVLAIDSATFTPFTGFGFLLVIFAAVVVGGIGKPYGAMLGALIVGVVTSLAASYLDSAYKDAVAFGVLILVLMVRPEGIFASRGRD
jgi:branched-subunit amino acid ABC-type transport system permease component